MTRDYGHVNYRRDPERYYTDGTEKENLPEIEARRNAQEPAPINMLLFCPKCGTQHIDAPEPEKLEPFDSGADIEYIRTPAWTNPPHRSHKCGACRTIWRPADVPTNGVAAVSTCGKADTWAAASPAEPAQSGEPDKWVAKVRVTANGYAMELSKYIAYALPEGIHELYAAPQPAHTAQSGEPVAYTSPDRLKRIAERNRHVDTMWPASMRDEGDIPLYTALQAAQMETALTEHLYVLSMNEETMEEAIQAFEGSAAGEALKCVLHAQKQLRAILTTARPASRGDHAE
ncbi:hypothetical protein PQR39_25980 [Paraburkholderia sediminicola]|uniref:hypothetical protein n=1 Tax=Paraburkholderia sediminicola TaxID=458836 RepID=UPI0038B85EB7